MGIEADVEGHPRDNEDETDLEFEEVETLQEDDFQVEIHISDMEEDIEGKMPFLIKKTCDASRKLSGEALAHPEGSSFLSEIRSSSRGI